MCFVENAPFHILLNSHLFTNEHISYIYIYVPIYVYRYVPTSEGSEDPLRYKFWEFCEPKNWDEKIAIRYEWVQPVWYLNNTLWNLRQKKM